MSRVIPGICMVAGWLLLLFQGPFVLFWAVILIGAVLALHEFFRMTLANLRHWRQAATIACCLGPVLAALTGHGDMILAGMMCSLLGLAMLALHGYGAMDDSLKYAGYAGFACVYVSGCMAHMVLLREHPQGVFWLTMLVAIVAGSDTGAYYAGRAFGKRKLFPLISPKKTVAGGVGGMVAGVAAAELVNLIFRQPAHPGALLLVAVVLVAIGIVGDLTESMIKRSVGCKDSGTILLGHGGLLDRLDSLLLTAPVLYYLLRFGMV
ncbi:phosphatidate cytidylyltransferase [Desulfobulbus sp.]|uniref:phosphatidate cytidylyltransferase n=1 Tax=Desulfobulbus sp. TaxID=895 RepID=UPI00286EC847|nr:phosphatidate cytidylyltransferase [Desulfobulbus sp.]